MRFSEKLQQAWQNTDSLLMVGLDPDPSRMPSGLAGNPDGLFVFCREIIDAKSPIFQPSGLSPFCTDCVNTSEQSTQTWC